jgi:hypothetical protein
MAQLKDPFYGAVIDVPDELVKRYTDAGYAPVEAKRSTTATRAKSSAPKAKEQAEPAPKAEAKSE